MQEIVDWIRAFIHGNQFQAFMVAVVIILITFIVSKILARLMKRVLHMDKNPLPASSILVNIVRVSIWVVGISVMLSACFNVNVNGILTTLGVAGIAVSLGLQNTIQNFFGGMQITLMKIIQPGDHIIVGTTEGIVKDVSWRQTVVRDFDGDEHLIPNMVISSEEIEKVQPDCLVVTSLVFAYTGGDTNEILSAMEQRAKAAIEKVATLKVDPWLLLDGIQSGALAATLRFVLADSGRVRVARDAALRAMAPFSVSGVSISKLEDEDKSDAYAINSSINVSENKPDISSGNELISSAKESASVEEKTQSSPAKS